MAAKKPLVITAGQIEQLQSGDYIVSNDLFNRLNDSGAAIPKVTPVYAVAQGEVAPAKADDAATMKVFGLSVAAIPDTESGPVQTDGVISATTGEWDAVTGGTGGLVTNSVYFLSAATAGRLTATAPTADGHFVCRVGVALSETELELSFQQPIKL